MNQPTPDDAFVLAAQRGDRDAFAQLVRRSARLVYARLYLDTRDVHRAEDLSQETFLLAWRRIGDLHDPSRFRAWLMQIAQSVLVDDRRRGARKKRTAPSAPASAIDAAHDGSMTSPDGAAARDEERDRALAILESLPEEYRQPLMLRYLGGADYEQIGKQLALTNGALRGLLQRGMKLLRERLNATERP